MAGIDSQWHWDSAPRVGCTGSIDASVSGTKVSASVSINQTLKPYSTITSWGFGSDTLHLFIDGSEVGSAAIGGSSGPVGSGSCSGSKDIDAPYDRWIGVEARMQCADPSCGLDHGGGANTWAVIGSTSVYVPNPYSPPSISITSVRSQINNNIDIIKPITRDNRHENELKVRYKITKGTDNITHTYIRLYNSSKQQLQVKDYSGDANGDITKSNVLFTGLTQGKMYYIRVSCTDGTNEVYSGYLAFYTYTEPVLDTTLTIGTTQPQNANTSNSFTIYNTNNVTWSDREKEFQTRYKIKRGNNAVTDWVNINNTTTWNRTESDMRVLVPKQYDGLTSTIYFQRYSTSADWESTNTASGELTLYYRPRVKLDTDTIRYFEDDYTGTEFNKGQIITNTPNIAGIYVSWNYDLSIPEAGYTQGYRIRLYNYNQDVINTYYTTSKNIVIPKEDIPHINMTYIDITPYFSNDSNDPDDYWYCSEDADIVEFIKIITELETPVITYPVEESNWINHEFRVCLQLPEDPDKDYVLEDYRYENIEIEINENYILKLANSNGTMSTARLQPTCFSCLPTNLTYKRTIVIYPNLVTGMTQSSTYRIRVRVKKKYGEVNTATEKSYRWSEWSKVRTFTVTQPQYNVNKYDLIMATHYNDAYDTVDRIRNTYGVTWDDKPLKVTAGSTRILAEQYSQNTIMKKLNDTKTQVNTYGEFDTGRNNVKFDVTDSLPTTFNEQQYEFITALKDDATKPGRNYIHYIYERCRLLV